jgi:hypothetical protein
MPATVAQRNKALRQERLRDFLSKQKLIEKLIDNVAILEERDNELDALMVQRLNAANTARIALIRKLLPDLKAQEITGEDGGPLNLKLIQYSEKK